MIIEESSAIVNVNAIEQSVPPKPLENISGSVYAIELRARWLSADDHIFGSYPEIFKDRGFPLLCLEVWTGSEDCENWADGGWDKLDGYFHSFLPIDLFFGKKDGDIVEIACHEKGKQFSLTCQKRNDRPFEEIMEDMFMVTYNILSDDYQKGKLTEETQQQWTIIDEMKRKYYPNSTIENRGFGQNIPEFLGDEEKVQAVISQSLGHSEFPEQATPKRRRGLRGRCDIL